MARKKPRPGVTELADGILMTELKPGTAPSPRPNGRVQVRYVGRLPDGTVFDQSTQPQWFRLDSVISGWTTALQHMPVGAKWRLVIPSAQAYGAEGAGDLIEPFTPLVFEIELVGTRIEARKKTGVIRPFFLTHRQGSSLSSNLFLVRVVQHFDQAVLQLEALMQQATELLEFLSNTLALSHRSLKASSFSVMTQCAGRWYPPAQDHAHRRTPWPRC